MAQQNIGTQQNRNTKEKQIPAIAPGLKNNKTETLLRNCNQTLNIQKIVCQIVYQIRIVITTF
jgi:hypothetical protein